MWSPGSSASAGSHVLRQRAATVRVHLNPKTRVAATVREGRHESRLQQQLARRTVRPHLPLLSSSCRPANMLRDEEPSHQGRLSSFHG